jgi:outer membrane immunogenic protein
MKSSLSIIGCVLFACATGTAVAADLPRAAPRAPAVAVPPVFSWSGLYVGLNVGYSFGRASTDYRFTPTGGPTTALGNSTTDPDGIIGGGQIGFNWQTGALVFGIEGDIQGSAQKGSHTFTCPAAVCGGPPFVTIAREDKMPWFATLRGRIGFAVDRVLLYGTGGLAVADIKSDATLTVPGLGSAAYSNSTTRAGWTLGAGIEIALLANWSAKLEYLYMDFGSFDYANAVPAALAPPAGGTIHSSTSFHDHVVRVGVNFRL